LIFHKTPCSLSFLSLSRLNPETAEQQPVSTTMATYDLTPRIAPNLDRHLVFPLLEFLQERQLYPDEQILKAKIELLNKTNMVDYAMDIHKSLYRIEDCYDSGWQNNGGKQQQEEGCCGKANVKDTQPAISCGILLVS